MNANFTTLGKNKQVLFEYIKGKTRDIKKK